LKLVCDEKAMTKPQALRRIPTLLILIATLIAGLPGCSRTGTPAQATTPNARATQAGPVLGPRVMGLPPLGSTYQEFVQALPAGVVPAVTGSPDLKAFEISPPQNIHGDIKSDRLVVQFASPNTAVERYWRLVAVAKLPWKCGPEDAKDLFEQQETAFKSVFEFTKRSLLANGNGASLSGVSKDRMLTMSVECTEQLMSLKYQYIDLNLFAYSDTAVRRLVENEYRKR
jgi:hypothetical protein